MLEIEFSGVQTSYPPGWAKSQKLFLFVDLFATLLTGEFVMTTLPIGSVELETQKTDKVRVFPYPFLEFEVWKTSCASIPSSFLSVLSLWLPSSSFFCWHQQSMLSMVPLELLKIIIAFRSCVIQMS